MTCWLTDMRPGDCGTVSEVASTKNLMRLQELGLLPGTPIKFVRRAPLGDPLQIVLRGYSMTLRGSEAAAVKVEVE